MGFYRNEVEAKSAQQLLSSRTVDNPKHCLGSKIFRATGLSQPKLNQYSADGVADPERRNPAILKIL